MESILYTCCLLASGERRIDERVTDLGSVNSSRKANASDCLRGFKAMADSLEGVPNSPPRLGEARAVGVE